MLMRGRYSLKMQQSENTEGGYRQRACSEFIQLVRPDPLTLAGTEHTTHKIPKQKGHLVKLSKYRLYTVDH